MAAWLNSHGLEVLVIYIVYSTLSGFMPPLPPGVGFFATWAYQAFRGFGGNAAALLKEAGYAMPAFKGGSGPGDPPKAA